MASLSAHVGRQDSAQRPQGHEIDDGSADLDPAVAVQLIAKTTNLSISGLGDEADEMVGSRDRNRSPSLPGVGTSDFVSLLLHSHVQPHAATTEEWRDDPSKAPPAVTTDVLTSASCSQIPESITRMGTGQLITAAGLNTATRRCISPTQLLDLPNELLLHILGCLDVCDLLAISRTSHHLRSLSLTPWLHHARLRRTRALLPPLLSSPSRPSRTDLIRRSIFLTHTAFASRRLARNLAAIRLSRRLASRPSAESLVQRCVLPAECLPSPARGGGVAVAPALVARKRAVERERVKDGLRSWVGSVWRGQVRVREEGVKVREERAGVGRVWRLRRFWEMVGKGEV